MPVEGRIKQVIIKYGSGEWYALICVSAEAMVIPENGIEKAIGIDLGIKSFRF